MKKNLLSLISLIFILVVVSLVSAHWYDPFHWFHNETQNNMTGYQITTTDKVVLLKKYTGLEKYLITDKSAVIVNDNLKIKLEINATVYNWMSDTYTNWGSYTNQQKLNKCNILKEHISEDYPNFDCLNSTHQTLLLSKVQNFATQGIKLIKGGVNKGYTNITGNLVEISIPISTLVDKEIIKLGEDSLEYEVQNQSSVAYYTSFNNLTISLKDNNVPLSVNNISISNLNSSLKFAGLNNNMTEDEIRNHTYTVKSTTPLFRDGNVVYVKNPIKIKNFNSQSTEIHEIDFSDVCNRGFECWVNETSEGNISICNVTASCEFSSYNIWNRNETSESTNLTTEIYDYYFEVNFTSDKNIDPTITISEEDMATTSLLTNVTAETGDANFTHLNISTEAPYDSLVGYWNFDGDLEDTTGATAYDWSGKGNDGTMNGDAVVNSSGGRFGEGLVLDGTGDYVTLSSNIAPASLPLTFSAWVNVKDLSAQGLILDAEGGNNYYGFFSLITTSGEFYMAYGDGGAPSGGSRRSGISSITIAVDGEWHHVVGVINGATDMVFYIDGVNDTSISYDGTGGAYSQGSAAGYIGVQNSGGDFVSDFNGSIDEVMIFNSSLSAAQITDIYNNQSARFKPQGTQKVRAVNVSNTSSSGNPGFDRVNLSVTLEANLGSNISGRIGMINSSVNLTGLVAYYPFEWGSAVDISGEGNDGTITNAVWNESGGVNETGGFEFDGSGDYIEDSDYDTNLTAFSFGAWVKFNDDYRQPIIIGGDGSLVDAVERPLDIYLGTGSSSLIFCDTRINTTDYTQSMTDVQPINGQWYHIMCVYNSTDMISYIGGVKKNETTLGNGVNGADGSNELKIGQGNDLYGWGERFFNGSIDQVMIFNRSLSATEISDLYENQSAKFNDIYYTPYQALTTDTNATFTISTEADYVFPFYEFNSGNTTDPFYSSVILGDAILDIYEETGAVADTTYPTFTDSWDDNESLVGSGIGNFNITVIDTNGTVFLEINNTNISSVNMTVNVYNATENFSASGTYEYWWWSKGNGTDNLYNRSESYYYTVNSSSTLTNVFVSQDLTLSNILINNMYEGFRQLTQSLTMTDNLNNVLYKGFKQLTQSLTLTNILFNNVGRITFLTQSLTLTDNLNNALYKGFRQVTQTITLTNVLFDSTGRVTFLTQVLTLTDNLNTNFGYNRFLYQGINLEVSISRTASFIRNVFQNIVLTIVRLIDGVAEVITGEGGGGGGAAEEELNLTMKLKQEGSWKFDKVSKLKISTFIGNEYTDIDNIYFTYNDLDHLYVNELTLTNISTGIYIKGFIISDLNNETEKDINITVESILGNDRVEDSIIITIKKYNIVEQTYLNLKRRIIRIPYWQYILIGFCFIILIIFLIILIISYNKSINK